MARSCAAYGEDIDRRVIEGLKRGMNNSDISRQITGDLRLAQMIADRRRAFVAFGDDYLRMRRNCTTKKRYEFSERFLQASRGSKSARTWTSGSRRAAASHTRA